MSKLKKWLACLSIACVATAFVGAVSACESVTDGLTPYIGENGNWWVGDEDLGVPATGPKGEKGDKGDTGEKGEPGYDGKDGADGKDGENGDGVKSFSVDENGHLIIVLTSGYEFDLGKITGDDGEQGETGAQGPQGEQGEAGEQGPQGEAGKDGRGIANVTVNENGKLVITYTDGTFETLDLGSTACVHSYSDWSVCVEATCSSMGYEVRTCSKCDDVDYKFNAYLGHSYGDWWAVSADGSMQCRTCLFCGETQTAHTIHTYVDGNCTICGEPQTKGLQYLEVEGGYKVYGIGTCTDTEIYIPSTYMGKPVVAIGVNSFVRNHTMTKLTIGKNVKEIDSVAFYDCDGLTEVLIPDNVETIGDNAFRDCDSIAKVTFGEGVERIGAHAFANCALLGSVDIPDNVTTMGQGVFTNCHELESVTIGKGLKTIPQATFGRCIALKSVTIPDNIESIEDNAFTWTGLTSVVFGNGLRTIGAYAFRGCEGLVEIVIPDSVEEVAESAFDGCTSLTKITLGKGVKQVALNAFNCGANQNNVYYTGTLSDWLTIDFYDSGLLWLETKLYIGGEFLENLVIPEGITEIKPYAFTDYAHLKSVTFTDEVKSIGVLAFCNCPRLQSVFFGKGLTAIGADAFSGVGLTSVTIPESVVGLGEGAFFACENLTDVTIGKCVQIIGKFAFGACEKLTNVTFENASVWMAGVTEVSETELSDTATAAEYLGKTYAECAWKRKQETV